MTAEVVARKIYEELISKYGVIKRIHTDMGTQFESELIRGLCEMYGIVKTETRSYHHEGVGAVESLNKTLKNMLRRKASGNSRKKYRKMMERNHNSNVTKCDTRWQRDYIPNNPVVGKMDKRFIKCNESKLEACEKNYGFQKTYCYCKRGEVENDFMVQFDRCKDLLHGECVKLSKTVTDKMKNFICKNCEVKNKSVVKIYRKFPNRFKNCVGKNKCCNCYGNYKLLRMFHFNRKDLDMESQRFPEWKILIYDNYGRDIISPLFSVKQLRENGITLHL
ncbi:hypothetical protein A3Q56_06953 [Intoshia linei]|uniref:Integrase catalytic domain-containing protein n=1 Tax=Intoshia linei TaxID=1819745 RepID=A0A177AV79_9BILA|nr:hypothetical protein A3Q56_06953 [Intoshia linei]